MKYSWSWLKEISGTKRPLEKVAADLTMRALEIEKIEKNDLSLPGVVVGKILEIKKHPNADKLQLVKVLTSPQPSPPKGEGVLEVVCGAWNIKVGDKVPVALVGTKLPSNMIIKAAEIRGAKSNGMLCAEDELGLGKDHSGIIILDKKAKIGDPAEKYLGTDDDVLEIKILPDRAHDVMSHVGLGREIAALENRGMEYDFLGLKLSSKKTRKIKVKIEDKKLCPRYIAAVMENIEVKESPKWMKDRLRACGMNSINNVVDATNYVMLELGQPLHAFDADKLTSDTIIIRRAKNGEEINLLDKGLKKLTNNDLIITNGGQAAALAGVKGAKIAGIDENTKNIVLEAANFNAASVRKSRILAEIKTEASDRYEKDIDPNLCEKAMARVIEILERTAGGKIEGILDVYPKKVSPWKIKLELDYVERLLGEKIPAKQIIKILNNFSISSSILPHMEGKYLSCIVPTFRIDLKTQEDLIEEIGRLWGYEKIEARPILAVVAYPGINGTIDFEMKTRKTIALLGFDETYNYSFYSSTDIQKCSLDPEKHLELENPMNPEQSYVRVSLLPNLAKNVADNLKKFDAVKIFETGKCYILENKNILEKRFLSAALVSKKDKKEEVFFELKGALEDFLETIGVEVDFENTKETPQYYIAQKSADIKIGNDYLGTVGEIKKEVLASYKISKNVAFFELDLEKLVKLSNKIKKYQPIPKFPEVRRDISLICPKNLKVKEIEKIIKEKGRSLLKKIELFDWFRKEGETSLAFHLDFGATDRTLRSEEVENSIKQIIKSLEDIGVKIKG